MSTIFDVSTQLTGNSNTNQTIDNLITQIGCDAFTSRVEGSLDVSVIVHNGAIIQEGINFSDDNFKRVHENNANALLAELKSVLSSDGTSPTLGDTTGGPVKTGGVRINTKK